METLSFFCTSQLNHLLVPHKVQRLIIFDVEPPKNVQAPIALQFDDTVHGVRAMLLLLFDHHGAYPLSLLEKSAHSLVCLNLEWPEILAKYRNRSYSSAGIQLLPAQFPSLRVLELGRTSGKALMAILTRCPLLEHLGISFCCDSEQEEEEEDRAGLKALASLKHLKSFSFNLQAPLGCWEFLVQLARQGRLEWLELHTQISAWAPPVEIAKCVVTHSKVSAIKNLHRQIKKNFNFYSESPHFRINDDELASPAENH